MIKCQRIKLSAASIVGRWGALEQLLDNKEGFKCELYYDPAQNIAWYKEEGSVHHPMSGIWRAFPSPLEVVPSDRTFQPEGIPNEPPPENPAPNRRSGASKSK